MSSQVPIPTAGEGRDQLLDESTVGEEVISGQTHHDGLVGQIAAGQLETPQDILERPPNDRDPAIGKLSSQCIVRWVVRGGDHHLGSTISGTLSAEHGSRATSDRQQRLGRQA
ncbi:hypothetical protein D3C86_1719580 [compost metagenome]